MPTACHFRESPPLLAPPIRTALTLALTCLIAQAALAQKLPVPTRTVFKCQEASGKTVYSDSPCPGAEKLEIQPTRGMNKSTGRELLGPDVRHEQHREQMAEALRPLTGMDAQQLDRAGRRTQLPPEAQRECHALDRAIPAAEHQERAAPVNERRAVQERLFGLRSQFRALRCD